MTLAVQALVLVAFAPLVQGAMRLLRARMQGRPGPSVVQPYRDVAKLWGKESLLPEGVSPIVVAAPGVVLGIALTFALSLPLVAHSGSGAFADIIALGFLLALGRFVLLLAALDTRSAFAGMAASRDATFGALVEPALVIALLGAARFGHGTALAQILSGPSVPATVLAFAALAFVTIAETARIPVDNQETHYELTMIHEGLLLEYGGRQLALLQLAAYVKQLAFFVLAALVITPQPWMVPGTVIALALGVTVIETLFAKLRLFEVPQMLATGFILAATSIGLQAFGGPS